MGRLDGRVAVVTGGGSGNGLAIAVALAREGAAVSIGEYSAARGAAAADRIESDGGRALFVPTDVRRWEDIDALVNETVASFGRLDIMVNNAGVLDGYATCLETSTELFDAVLGINLRGTFFGCKRALAETIIERYGAMAERSRALRAEPARVIDVIVQGSEMARQEASRTMDEVRHALRIAY